MNKSVTPAGPFRQPMGLLMAENKKLTELEGGVLALIRVARSVYTLRHSKGIPRVQYPVLEWQRRRHLSALSPASSMMSDPNHTIDRRRPERPPLHLNACRHTSAAQMAATPVSSLHHRVASGSHQNACWVLRNTHFQEPPSVCA